MGESLPEAQAEGRAGFLLILRLKLCRNPTCPTKNSVQTRFVHELRSTSPCNDGDESIYLIGGSLGQTGVFLNDRVFKYNITNGKVDVVGHFIEIYEGAGFFHSDHIYYFGGRLGDLSGPTTNITRYSVQNGAHSVINNLPAGVRRTRGSYAWDSVAGVGYLFGGWNQGYSMDQIFQYTPSTNVFEQVGRLLEPIQVSSAAFTPDGVYIFDGYGSASSAISRFDPTTNSVTRVTDSAPYRGCVFYASRTQQLYILHDHDRTGIQKFHPVDGRFESVEVDPGSWPSNYDGGGCVYVPKLHRVYAMGGFARFPGEASAKRRDEISYFDLGDPEPVFPTSTEPIDDDDCSDGQPKVISDPECCTRFIVCVFGVGTRYDCGEGEQFSPVSKQCEDKHHVNCGIHYN